MCCEIKEKDLLRRSSETTERDVYRVVLGHELDEVVVKLAGMGMCELVGRIHICVAVASGLKLCSSVSRQPISFRAKLERQPLATAFMPT